MSVLNLNGSILGQDTGGASAFTDLTDTPENYTEKAGQFVKVKADETGLETVAGSDDSIKNALIFGG